jgi:NAD(P)H-hydrate repair Nnr-like enzyme with NAD(P)H-hydrate epimerase domain
MRIQDIIAWVNEPNCSVSSLDIPSGNDADHGAIYEPEINATAKITLASTKIGVKTYGANPYPSVILRDISITPGRYAMDPLNLVIGN